MRPLLLLIFLLLVLCACKERPDEKGKTFKVILPDSIKTYQPKAYVRRFKELSSTMGLSSIDKGVDSFELRLWISSMLIPNQLIVLKKSDSAYVGQRIEFFLQADGRTSFKKHEINDSITLKKTMIKLRNHDFRKMISQYEISNFTDNIADGVTYTLEIATNEYYKFITYHCPEKYIGHDIYNKSFSEIVKELDSTFQFYIPYCQE